MDAETYFQETEPAVKHLLKGLSDYDKMLKDISHPVFVAEGCPDNPGNQETFNEWRHENNEAIQEARAKTTAYLGLTFSIATLSGAVLQIAYMGIKLFSQNDKMPELCASLLDQCKDTRKIAPFCIGREVFGLPIGIIIYAGRNQYNHWNTPLRQLNESVFACLTHHYDLAFDLKNPHLKTLSHNILSVLEWRSYEDYDKDMRVLCNSFRTGQTPLSPP